MTFVSKYLGTKDFWKRALVLALPIAMQNMLTSSFSLIDTIMVGQLGDVALSAVGMAGQWSWLLNIVIFGVCSGTSVLVSQYWGAKDINQIHRVSGLAILVGLIVSTIFVITGLLFPETVVTIFNRNSSVIEKGSAYLRIACLSYPGTVLNTILCSILRSTERVKLPVLTALITTVLNVILDYVLIFGAFGIPAMGIEGAAIATCISAWLGPVILIGVALAKKDILLHCFAGILKIDKGLIRIFSSTAIPVLFNESLWGFGTFLYNVIFANLGYENYAAVTILKTIENLAYVFFIGMCNACCVIVGKEIGGGNIKRSVDDARRFAVTIPLLGIVIGAGIIVLRPYLIGLFNFSGELTEKTLYAAMTISLIYAIELAVKNISYTFIVGVFRSGGDTVNGAKIDIMSMWLVALPITAIAAFIIKLPFPVVFAISYLAEDYIKATMSIRHFISCKWIKPVTQQGRENLEIFIQSKAK